MKSKRRRSFVRKAADMGSPRGQATPRPSGERGAAVATTTASSQQPTGLALAMVCATAQSFPQPLKQQSLSRVDSPSGTAQSVFPDSAASIATFPGHPCDQDRVVGSPSIAPVTSPAEGVTCGTGRPGRSEPTACMGTFSKDLPDGSSQPHVSTHFLYQVGISSTPETFFAGGQLAKVASQDDGVSNSLYALITHDPGMSPQSDHRFKSSPAATEMCRSVEEAVHIVATAQQKPEATAGQAAPCSGRAESESPVQLTELVAVSVSKLSPCPSGDCSICPATAYGGSGARSLLPPICTMASFSTSGSGSVQAALYGSYYKTELLEQNAASYQVRGKELTSLDSEVRLTASHSLSEHAEYHHHYSQDQQHQHASANPCGSCGPDCPGLAWGAYSSTCPTSALCRSYCCGGESGCGSGSLQHSAPDSVQQMYHPHLPVTSTGPQYVCPSLVVATSSDSPQELRPEATDQRWGGMVGCQEATYPAHTGLPAAGTYVPGGYTSACTTPQGVLSTAGDRYSNADSSGSAYFSDDSCGADGASMRDIQQEILRADLQRHIYENYSSHLSASAYPSADEDDDDDDEDDDESQTTGEGEGAESDGSRRGSSSKRPGSKRKGSSPFASSSTKTTGKRRRRRTQTPNQRRAANMRERKRMCHLNTAFDALKNRLPSVRSRKKLSRIQTLRAAICYIGILSDCIHSA